MRVVPTALRKMFKKEPNIDRVSEYDLCIPTYKHITVKPDDDNLY